MRKTWAAILIGAFTVMLVTGVALVVLALRGDSPPPSAGPTATTPAATTPAPTPSAASSPSPSPAVPSPSPTPRPTASVTTPSTRPFPPWLAGIDVSRIPTAERVVALTFDAGANADGLPSILDTLAKQGIRATFFLEGGFTKRYPAQVAAIIAGGHRVANHSATHPYFTKLTDAQIADELRSAERTIRSAGADPRPLFRFPFGDRNARTIAAVNNTGYVAVRWTVDTLGWQGTSGGRTAQQVVDRAMNLLQPGEIVLMHVGSHPTDRSTLDADALPQMISRMRAAGYHFDTLDLLLAGRS